MQVLRPVFSLNSATQQPLHKYSDNDDITSRYGIHFANCGCNEGIARSDGGGSWDKSDIRAYESDVDCVNDCSHGSGWDKDFNEPDTNFNSQGNSSKCECDSAYEDDSNEIIIFTDEGFSGVSDVVSGQYNATGSTE